MYLLNKVAGHTVMLACFHRQSHYHMMSNEYHRLSVLAKAINLRMLVTDRLELTTHQILYQTCLEVGHILLCVIYSLCFCSFTHSQLWRSTTMRGSLWTVSVSGRNPSSRATVTATPFPKTASHPTTRPSSSPGQNTHTHTQELKHYRHFKWLSEY